MSELVPERRPNKNGVMVTRWVKPDGKAISGKTIPTPVVTSSVPDSVIQSLESLVNNFGMEEEKCVPILMRNVKKMGPHAEAFMDLFEFHAGASDLFYDIADVTELVYGPDSLVKEQHRGTVMMNFMSILPPYFDGKDEEGIEAAHFAAVLFRGIDGFKATEPYTDDEKTAYTVAAGVIEYVRPLPGDDQDLNSIGFRKQNSRVELLDRRSADLLLENVGDADLIGAELMKRETFHADVVQEIVKHGVLRDGSL